MSSQYLSLEEAAEKLGITTDQLVAYRSDGRVRGFRDGGSWKFPEDDLNRLADELAEEGGSYDPYQLLDDAAPVESPSSSGSALELDLELDDEPAAGSRLIGSDVNLVAGDDGSDVKVVSVTAETPQPAASGGSGGLMELDPDDLSLEANEPILSPDSGVLDLAIDPKTGSTGPIAKRDAPAGSGLASQSDLAFDAADDDDSDDDVLGMADEDFAAGAVGSDLSGVNLGDDLRSGSADVLSDIDLLRADADGSGLISGDSDRAIGLGSDVLGGGPGSSGVGAGSSGKGSGLMLDDGDDLLITDDDDDELDLGGSDLSISGDSGINLMSPSDSGISLESEPLDLAGSGISALDLGGELSSSGGSSGKGAGSRSGVGAEDFQLSPSGLSLDADADSSSQVIEVEDSAALASDPVDPLSFGGVEEVDEAFAEPADDGFGGGMMGDEGGFGDELAGAAAYAAPATPEVPYRPFEVAGLVCVAVILCLSGMLMSDLVRNMWSYAEPVAPVSGITDWLLDLWAPK